MLNKNSSSPVALLNINRDSRTFSHRNIKKNVKNTRDILNVADYSNERRFDDEYRSPIKNKSEMITPKAFAKI